MEGFDWNYGEHRYGEKHAQAVPGKDYQTKADAAWVAGRVGFSLRNENLSFKHHEVAARIAFSRHRERLGFGHHAEVAHLEPAEHWDRGAVGAEGPEAAAQLLVLPRLGEPVRSSWWPG